MGLSLRDLGRRVGVSASLISQIERDKVNPSVSTLWGLVRELGLTMGDLFAAESPPPAATSARPAAIAGPLVTPEGRAVINLASGVTWERLTAASDPTVEFLRVVYDVGSESCPEHSLVHHGGKEYGYVISGRLGVRIGFDEYDLGPGYSISFDASSPHRLWAIGNEPAEVIWAVVGRQGDSRTGPLS
jgi:transcriptional regulator with XRE-family HTH domain